jgi:hypothetical protein
MSEAVLERPLENEEAVLPFSILLELNVRDPELIRELKAHPEGRARDEYALCALRIGLLALKQARGQLDADTVRHEGERILGDLKHHLEAHANGLGSLLTTSLKEYFDPETGRLPERIKRLIDRDGELEQVLRRQVGQQDSELCKTLLAHIGKDSPLLKKLSPDESEGILKALRDTLSEQLESQRASVLKEFSLDRDDSALSRLIQKLAAQHGDAAKDLGSKIDAVVKEFSLDGEDTALSRLVRRVTEAQRLISSEFSLDNEQSALSRMAGHLKEARQAIDSQLTLDVETSALARLKRELLDLLNRQAETAQRFQDEVKNALNELRIRRAEAQRSTLHGKEFEQAVYDFVHSASQKVGDVAEFTGHRTGDIKNCKVGDVVVELGPGQAAAGAKIVVECKDEAGYSLPKARVEIEQARKNRGASVGLFVFAKANAPAGLVAFQRLGDDLFIVWNPDDPQSDLYLDAGLLVARALCTRQAQRRGAVTADFETIAKSILDIEKKAGSLEEIATSAESIASGADKILKRVRIAREGIEKQVAALRSLMEDLKSVIPGEAAS